MARIEELTTYLADYLEVDAVDDYGPNGLQVEGRGDVVKLVTGVSACRQLFVAAREAGADAVLVHHGLFWHGQPMELVGVQYRRVAELIRHDIGLLAYHLPLDRHPEVGNNAVAARRLGLGEIEPFGDHGGVTIGFQGVLPAPLRFDDFAGRCGELFGQPPLALGAGPEEVRSVGIISGGAQKEIHQAIAAGLDVFITGEASEWVTNLADEAGIHFLAAGHYATERLGPMALGDHLEEHFGLEVEFIDVWNPV